MNPITGRFIYLMAEYQLSSESYFDSLNPFKNHANITDVWGIINLFAITLTGLAGLIAIAYIVYGGYQYITSMGNPENSKQAVSTITWSVIGLIVIMLAYMIIEFTITFLQTGKA